MITADLAIIGAGSGGLSLAAGAGQLGAKVVLIEAAKMGGDCLNTGCVPSKALIAAAKAAGNVRQSPKAFLEVMAKVKAAIATIAPHDSQQRFEGLGCQVLQGHASFVDPHTLAVGDQRIQASRIVIATGSQPLLPPIEGLSEARPLTHQTVFNLELLPKQLLVIGGGPMGCEFAQAFAHLGAEVTVVERGKLLSANDPDCVAVVSEAMRDDGIRCYEQVAIKSVAALAERRVVVIERDGVEEVITAEATLVTAGRKPCVEGLALDKAGVEVDGKGITVDAHCRTNQPHIYAIGDVCGGFQFTHMANHQAGVVLKHALFRLPAKVETRAIPWVTYTEPELAHVGMTEHQAKMRFPKAVVLEVSYPAVDRAVTDGLTRGKIKVTTTPGGRVLGATIVGAQAGELILPWVMLVQQRQSIKRLTEIIVPYPTLSELHKQVANQFYRGKVFSPLMRRIVGWLKR